MKSIQDKTIIKIGAVIMNASGQMLAVHKRGKPARQLIVPGGKQEKGETDEQTLQRELFEELNVEVSSHEFLYEFKDKAIYENAWLMMKIYRVTIIGNPQPSTEIDQLVWLDSSYEHTEHEFASILGKQLLPKIFPSVDTSYSR